MHFQTSNRPQHISITFELFLQVKFTLLLSSLYYYYRFSKERKSSGMVVKWNGSKVRRTYIYIYIYIEREREREREILVVRRTTAGNGRTAGTPFQTKFYT